MLQFRKVYVEVVAKFTEDGKIVPLSIQWEDGRNYEIDRINDVRPRSSLKVGGVGERFDCRICGHNTFLFLENGRWFVEAKIAT